MSEAAKRMKANLKLEGKPCLWCRAAFKIGDDIANCSSCATDQHAACWDKNGGCAMAGCPNAPLKRLDDPPATQRRDPWGSPSPAPSRAGERPPPAPGFKYCTACNNQVQDSAQICDFCNAILSPDGIYHGPTVNAPGATSSLVFGIVGLFICGLIFGALAISKSREAKNTIAFNPRYGGSGLATAGFVLGVIDIIAWAIIIILQVGRLSH
jgi:hypothetical protein